MKYRKRDIGLSFTGRVFLAFKVKEAGEVERILICPVKLRDKGLHMGASKAPRKATDDSKEYPRVACGP